MLLFLAFSELMGNLDKAKKLKEKLEEARAANEMAKASGRPIETETETVVLTRTDSKGLVRPIQADVATDVGKSRKGKVQTHADGQRVRYFADDDRFDLKQMYEREKLSTAEDQNMMMSRLAGKAIGKKEAQKDVELNSSHKMLAVNCGIYVFSTYPVMDRV